MDAAQAERLFVSHVQQARADAAARYWPLTSRRSAETIDNGWPTNEGSQASGFALSRRKQLEPNQHEWPLE